MTYLRTIAIIVITLQAGQGTAADIFELADDTTIVVSADEAWEDTEQDILYFHGHFEIRTPSWRLSANEATVYGNLDDPQRIVADGVVDGPPVYFFFLGSGLEDSVETAGEGQHLEYEQELGLLTLSGKAKLTSGTRVMQSSKIEYDLEKQQLKAGGAEGVHVTVNPDDVGN